MGEQTVREWFRHAFALTDARSDAAESPVQVGELALAPFQGRAAARGLRMARAFGGVVLADAVGLGKTRVSLAIAKALTRDARLRAGRAGPVWVCVPARLRRQWDKALTRAGIAEFEVVTHTALSRGEGLSHVDGPGEPAVVVVDEAHRFRNPKAKRSRALARLAACAPVILATATPVCNSQWDLYHLLSLFLGEHDLRGAIGHDLRDAFELAEAGRFDLTELVEQVVIRRTEPPSRAGFGRRPNVSLEVLGYEARGAELWLWRHLEAELERMTLELFRADWPRPLLLQYVLKRWESGADALADTLAQMSAFHARWLEADAHGRTLSRKSFRQLFDGELGRRQGVFPFLFDGPAGPTFRREAVERDLEVLHGLERRVQAVLENGDAKRDAILALVRGDAHKTLVFTSYQRAARGLYDYLVEGLGATARVGLVTGNGCEATGLGRVGADEIVRRFAPQSNGGRSVEPHQRLDVLVATDCLAEGVNLQDCGRVVLADLPYSPLGVEQRIGRLVRPGGPHERVTVYLPRPRSWTDSLGMRRRLDDKLAQAAASGAGFVAASRLATEPTRASPGGATDDAQTLRPLAALTRLDALAESLRGEGASAFDAPFWCARTARDIRCLWVLVAIEDAETTRWTWLRVREDGEVESRLAALLDGLARDADLRSPVAPAEPHPEMLEAARGAIERREKLLRAARLAPFPVRLDAPQRRLWAELHAHVEEGALDLAADELAGLRHELLRSFPRGTERRLAELCRADLPPGRLLAQVRRVVGDVPQWSPHVRLRIVAGLQVG